MMSFFRLYIFRATALATLWFLAGFHLPASVLAGGAFQLTSYTPFDRKVNASGLFRPSILGSSDSIRGLDLRRIFEISRSFRYVADAYGDHWQTPEETEAKRAGDCEDKSIWLFSRLKMSGYMGLRLVVGKYRPTDRQYHVWVTYQDPSGKEYLLDPVKQRNIWTINEFSDGLYKPIYSFDGTHRYRYQH